MSLLDGFEWGNSLEQDTGAPSCTPVLHKSDIGRMSDGHLTHVGRMSDSGEISDGHRMDVGRMDVRVCVQFLIRFFVAGARDIADPSKLSCGRPLLPPCPCVGRAQLLPLCGARATSSPPSLPPTKANYTGANRNALDHADETNQPLDDCEPRKPPQNRPL